MAKLKPILLLFLLASSCDSVSANNCEFETIGKLGAEFVLDVLDISVIGGTIERILELFWPDNCSFVNIQAFIDLAINKERQKIMSDRFHGFKKTFAKAKFLNWTTDPSIMAAFYMDLNEDEDMFLNNNIEDAAIYVR